MIRTSAVLLGLAGCTFAAPYHHGPVSDHFDGELFFNPDDREEISTGALLRWAIERHMGPWDHEMRHAPIGKAPPSEVSGGRLRVTFVGHATLLVQVDGKNFLTDPVWSETIGPVAGFGFSRLRPPGIRFDDLPKIDVVLISHNHYDHLDVPTLARLMARDHPKIIVGLGNTALLEREGITGGQDLDWWQEREVGNGVRVISVPVHHSSNRALNDRRRTLWTGYVIDSPSGRIYFAGDTAMGPHFAETGARFGPFRLALLPIGAYNPRWVLKRAHISPAEAVLASQALRAEFSVAMHYGTFPEGDDGEFEPLRDLDRALQEAHVPHSRFWALEFGEGREVPRLGVGPTERRSSTAVPRPD
jgi:L-ascorbate metabolism protein UlaG (beta-lactamase superfamily)